MGRRFEAPLKAAIQAVVQRKRRIAIMKRFVLVTLALTAALISMLPGLSAAGINMQHNQTAL